MGLELETLQLTAPENVYRPHQLVLNKRPIFSGQCHQLICVPQYGHFAYDAAVYRFPPCHPTQDVKGGREAIDFELHIDMKAWNFPHPITSKAAWLFHLQMSSRVICANVYRLRC